MLGWFATGAIPKENILGYYHGSLVQTVKTGKQVKRNTHDNGVMQVAAKRLRKYMNEIPEKLADKEGADQKVWIIRAPLCVMRHINDARYFSEDTISEFERVRNQL